MIKKIIKILFIYIPALLFYLFTIQAIKETYLINLWN